MFTDEQLDVIQREYEAFRLHHARLGTEDSPAGFAARFRVWLKETYG